MWLLGNYHLGSGHLFGHYVVEPANPAECNDKVQQGGTPLGPCQSSRLLALLLAAKISQRLSLTNQGHDRTPRSVLERRSQMHLMLRSKSDQTRVSGRRGINQRRQIEKPHRRLRDCTSLARVLQATE